MPYRKFGGPSRPYTLEFQSCFAGGVGQGLDAAVIHSPAAIEGNSGDSGGLAALGDGLAGGLGGGDVGAGLERAAHLGAGGGNGGQSPAGHVVDQLGVNVLSAAIDGQPGSLRGAENAVANAVFAAIEAFLFFYVFICHGSSTPGGVG